MESREYHKITLTTSEPFRVGGVKDPISRADNQVARLGNKIIIPGPTLKGALRHRIEKFLIQQFYQSGKWEDGMEDFQPCIPGTPTDDERGLIEQGKYRRRTCHYASKDRNKSTPTICPVCYLLGANGLLGFVRVPFLELNNPHNRVPQLYAARNDRAINTEVHQTNRSYETIAPGATFQGTLEIMLEDKLLEWNFGAYRTFWRIKINEKKEELIKNEDLDRWLKNNKAPGKQIIINDYILGCLRDIKELGGYKSKGFGKVDIHVEKIEAAQ